MTVLVTGYEPFGDHETNPSETVARRLDGETVAGHDVVGAVLPVAFGETDEFGPADDRLVELVAEHDPAAVVATGLAAGRPCISVERVGINVDDAVTVPDNDDRSPRDERVDPDGPDAYLSTLPVVATVEALAEAGVPARVSNTAGTYLCNHALYRLHDFLADRDGDVPAGFLHLPLTPEGAVAAAEAPERGGGVQPSLPLALQAESVRVALETALG